MSRNMLRASKNQTSCVEKRDKCWGCVNMRHSMSRNILRTLKIRRVVSRNATSDGTMKGILSKFPR